MKYNIIMSWQAQTRIAETILIFFVFALGCSAAHSTMQRALDKITITEKNNGGEVRIAPGCILILKLEAIPGAGYAWQVVRNNTDLLKLLGEYVFEPLGGDTKKEILGVGAPEYQVFRFETQRSGTNILELHYKREWEKEITPLKIFRITLQIQ
jgi:inhibitor of cysteine peptidase